MLALPCCCRGGSVNWDGDSAEGASATGLEEEPPPRLHRSPLVGGAGACVACPLPAWWPLAEAAVEPVGGIGAAGERGHSRPLRCG